MDSAVQNRQAYQTGGSIAGSLGGSVGWARAEFAERIGAGINVQIY